MDSDGFLPPPSPVVPHTVGHLALFNQHLQKMNRQVEWVYSDGFKNVKAGSNAAPTMNAATTLDSPNEADGIKPQYNDMGLHDDAMVPGTHTTPIWYVKVMVDGVYYGRGRGNTKRAARNEAAKEGLHKLGIIVW